MNNPTIVLADLDANYLVPLEEKLAGELYNQVSLEVITDKDYFDEYFSSSRKIDTLVISQSLFSQSLLKHNITDIFVLTEETEENRSSDNVSYIFKYSSTKEIFSQVLKNRRISNIQFKNKDTQVIVVTSAAGGAGKTTLSLALSLSLSKSYKRVLYLSTDYIQSFTYYTADKSRISNQVARAFTQMGNMLFETIRPHFRTEGFTYLPAFNSNILSLGFNNSIYLNLIKAAKEAKEYDYIIVDTDAHLDESKAELIQQADKVIITVLQDAFSALKTECLMNNLGCKNPDKFLFVCNKFHREYENEYIASNVGRNFLVSEYVDKLSHSEIQSLDTIADLSGIRNLTYLFS